MTHVPTLHLPHLHSKFGSDEPISFHLGHFVVSEVIGIQEGAATFYIQEIIESLVSDQKSEI
jgi:hypothetical protein